jgi:hypothetical protein
MAFSVGNAWSAVHIRVDMNRASKRVYSSPPLARIFNIEANVQANEEKVGAIGLELLAKRRSTPHRM